MLTQVCRVRKIINAKIKEFLRSRFFLNFPPAHFQTRFFTLKKRYGSRLNRFHVGRFVDTVN